MRRRGRPLHRPGRRPARRRPPRWASTRTVAATIALRRQAGAERTLRLARKDARLRDAKLTAAYKAKLGAMTVRRARRRAQPPARRDRQARKAARRARAPGPPVRPASPQLEAIAACESGGNPSTDTGNGFYGKYQFTQSTWAAVGGSGNPAAAPEAEQDRRAAKLLARAGSGQWPVCGR